MNPLEQIKEGIVKMNWTTVCNGYEALTGEFLHSEQEPETGDKKALQQIYDIVALAIEEPGYVPSTFVNIADISPKPKKKKSGRPKGSRKKTSKKSTSVDKDGEDSSLNLDPDKKTVVQQQTGGVRLITNELDPIEVEANKILAEKSRINKTSAVRSKIKKFDVKCSECDNEFKSDRPGGEMGQKCKRCLMGTKSRFV